MPDEIRVEFHGVAELAQGNRILAGRIDKAADKAFQGVAQQVASDLRGRVPHRTGRLAGSVTGGGAQGGAEVEMGAGVPYAQFVEYGGRGFSRSAQGNFLYPTAMGAEDDLVKAGTQAANREIGSMSWPTPS